MSEELKKKLASLRETYLRQLPEKIEHLEDCWNRILNGYNENDLKDLHRLAHSIAGSSSSFGYTEIGRTARSLESVFKNLIGKNRDIDDTIRAEVNSYISLIKEYELSVATVGEGTNSPLLRGVQGCVSPLLMEGDEGEGERYFRTKDKKLIFIAEDDQLLLNSLELQIRHFGYDVKAFSDLEEMEKALKEITPSAIISDVVFPEGNLAGIETIEKIKKENDRHLPVIFMSIRNDIHTRLQAARAGGIAYILKPINITSLIDKLDILTTYREIEPYRILIVDDEIELGNYHSMVLENAGMKTKIVNDPLHVFEPMIEFSPDLILMDIYMPACNGHELAKAIRQMEAFFSIPIVFLSSEANIDKQITAMSMGGDYFLTKPVEPEHLISSVAIRAERMRVIRSFMVKDSLTGLLNHTNTKESLDISVEQAKRKNGNLAFAMIDIDRFKSINDTYGHPAGDRVILSLSRLLQQRLRKTDIVGRYGGEEFAVILIDTDEQTATKVMDEIRSSFAQIKHQSGEKDFYVTFSCGIATFPLFADATNLCNAADRALYEAKHGGRNRIVTAAE
ncbi:MAG: diguanylate cyclase [Nitrospirae bacterium]|nr:diguanylate cyclase [Nitrospirota bacterium]